MHYQETICHIVYKLEVIFILVATQGTHLHLPIYFEIVCLMSGKAYDLHYIFGPLLKAYCITKLDGVGPVDNRPSTDKLQRFDKKFFIK